MLRMYRCNWCFEFQVRDDDSVKRVQQGDRMHTVLVGHCNFNCKHGIRSNMNPMIKDVNGDWFESDRNVRRSKKEVVPPIIWH